MIEHRPGEFGEIGSVESQMKKLMNLLENEKPVTALHIGTVEELTAKKFELSQPTARKSDIEFLQQQMDDVKQKLTEFNNPRTVRGLTIPNQEEIEKFGVS